MSPHLFLALLTAHAGQDLPSSRSTTTGAVCGQLAGAFWGESNAPGPLRSGLARRDMPENALPGTLSR
jgi:hypothetical protein